HGVGGCGGWFQFWIKKREYNLRAHLRSKARKINQVRGGLTRRLIVAEPDCPAIDVVRVRVQLLSKLFRCESELHHIDLFQVDGGIDGLIQEARGQLTPVKVQESIGLNLLYAQAQFTS